MTNLILHKTRGVNPHLTFCRKCHGESEELILLGANDGKYECPKCKLVIIGRPIHKCRTCKMIFKRIGVVGEHERVPSHDICDKCKAEIKEHEEIVRSGGVYWKCDKCNNSGVIKASTEFAAEVRKANNTFAPDLCGIDFTGSDTLCPVCSK